VNCAFSAIDNANALLTNAECPLVQTLQNYDEATNAW
jgi:hypothetical protein